MLQNAPDDIEVFPRNHSEVELTSISSVQDCVSTIRPDVVINASRYTNVDKAKEEPELAYTVNRDGVANLAKAAAGQNAVLVHISTDFVFNALESCPYKPEDECNPVSDYSDSLALFGLQIQTC